MCLINFKDIVDSEWEFIPDADDIKESFVAPTKLQKFKTFDSQTELADFDGTHATQDSPRQNRYSSPLFQQLLAPIEPIRIIQSTVTIPVDESLNNLFHVANMVSQAQKTHENPVDEPLTDDNAPTTPTNNTNDFVSLNDHADDILLNKDLVPEKRTSIDDPETVLMDAIVPGNIFIVITCIITLSAFYFKGSFAEREHLKWLHAAPIARNPYSAEVLQRRLSDRENDHKSKVLSLSNHQLVDILVEESAQGHDSSKDNEDDEDVVKPKKVDMKK